MRCDEATYLTACLVVAECWIRIYYGENFFQRRSSDLNKAFEEDKGPIFFIFFLITIYFTVEYTISWHNSRFFK